jgi:chromosomal replication initiation ATPase DnaA
MVDSGETRVMESYRAPVTDADETRAGLALHLVAASTGVSMRALGQGQRLGMAPLRARRLAMYLAHVSFGWTVERVGHAFGMNRATASSACRWAEDQRENPALDAMLETLEGCLRAIVCGGQVRLTA